MRRVKTCQNMLKENKNDSNETRKTCSSNKSLDFMKLLLKSKTKTKPMLLPKRQRPLKPPAPRDVEQIQASGGAFAAIRADGQAISQGRVGDEFWERVERQWFFLFWGGIIIIFFFKLGIFWEDFLGYVWGLFLDGFLGGSLGWFLLLRASLMFWRWFSLLFEVHISVISVTRLVCWWPGPRQVITWGDSSMGGKTVWLENVKQIQGSGVASNVCWDGAFWLFFGLFSLAFFVFFAFACFFLVWFWFVSFCLVWSCFFLGVFVGLVGWCCEVLLICLVGSFLPYSNLLRLRDDIGSVI